MDKAGTIPQVEIEVPDLGGDDPSKLVPWRPADFDPKKELQNFEAMVELQNKMRPASIKATLPEDWIAHGEVAYLQATGVERLAPLWGLLFGRYTVTKIQKAGGAYAFEVRGPVMSRRTGVVYADAVGGRSSDDPFFDSYDEPRPPKFNELPGAEQEAWKRSHRVQPDELDVKKAAVTNWTTRAATMLAGLRGLTVAYLEANGVKGIKKVEYGSGSRGGDTAPAEIKTARTAFWNDILKAVGGEPAAAKSLLKEITAGKDFSGFDSVDSIRFQWQIDNARKKLDAHSIFGKGKKPQREPGEEG